MSWSLKVSNGDLVVGASQLSTVTGHGKLIQDLRHYLLEKMGTDPLHKTYGSLIDGGTRPDGIQVLSPIGSSNWSVVTLNIRNDIYRIGNAYQQAQLARIKSDRLRYNKVTLTASEILSSIDSITFGQNADSLFVTVNITAGDNSDQTLNLTISGSAITQ